MVISRSLFLRIVFLLTCLLYAPGLLMAADLADEYRMRQPQSKYDASHAYYAGLLELALKKTEAEYGKGRIIFQANLNQGRELLELKRGELINIAMVGTDRQREQDFIPIRIPLNKGVLGYRIPIIHKDNINKFDRVKTLGDLKKLTACQGEHWPDSDIMEAAGITVIRNQDYESMFGQLEHKRCDFFPRGINEGFGEMEARQATYPDLMLYDKLVLSYTFPMYYFISPQYPRLAERLEKGMLGLIGDGEMDKYIAEHPVTRSLFPVEKWKNTLELRIDNPILPKKTPLTDKRFWLKLPFRQPADND